MKKRLSPPLALLPGVLVLVLCAWPLSAYASAPGLDCLEFDGTQDLVTVPDHDALDLTGGAFTLSVWIRPTGWGANQQGRILDHGGGGSSGTGWSFHLENKASKGSPQSLRVQIGGDTVDRIADQASILIGVWQQATVTYEAGTLRFFVDGVPRGVHTGVPAPLAAGLPVRVGQRADDLERGFEGSVDELRIWDRALGETEILAYCGVELSGGEAGLVAYLGFDEGSGQSVGDSAGGSHDGHLGLSPDAEVSDPLWFTYVPPLNQAPEVEVGPDRSLILPDDSVALDGTVSDDGLPAEILITLWSQVSGPGVVSFDDETAIDTLVTLPSSGVYVLRLEADDGELVASDELSLTLDEEARLAALVVEPSAVTLEPGEAQQFLAEGRDQAGEAYPADPLWSATGGLIDASGLYTAGGVAGVYSVEASEGEVSGAARVTVLEGPLSWPTAGWATATPEEMGMDPVELAQARDYALTGDGAGYITRHGRLVMSWGGASGLLDLKSTTKSIGSSALGLALGDGLVEFDDPARSHYAGLGLPPSENEDTGWLDGITLRQLATQTGGFDKPSGYIDLLHEPGGTWTYSDGGINWLADTLTVVFGEDLDSLLFRRVFATLGIERSDLVWRDHLYRDDTVEGIKRRELGSGIRMNVDGMARVGYLFLRRGRWDGQQILPEPFVLELGSPPPHLSGLPVFGDLQQRFGGAPGHYGQLWWNNADGSIPDLPPDAYWSWGLNDSLIVVIPSLDIVASRAGSAWSGDRSPSFYQVLAPFLRPIARSVIDTPGEAGPSASPLLVTGYDEATGEISLLYGTACGAGDNTIRFGPLTRVALETSQYTGAECSIGNSGLHEGFDPGPGSFFFLVVANDGGALEGSYGRDSQGIERAADGAGGGCLFSQDLAARCD